MDPLSLGMLAILALLVFFMFRNGQKRKRDLEALRSKVQPGAEVMTNFGMFGRVASMNEETNQVGLEIAPGVVIDVHSQAIARVVEDETAEPAEDEVPVDVVDTPGIERDERPVVDLDRPDDQDKK